ncbi:hypothetical protein [Curtobacterium sp. ER1/6]|uniref:hypothetical protein n=1 Tax=Curtobacterium sp. ER1/6 TaxID=1891920 RepID=UPI00086AFA0B|nr:hypothetical protein [Curtobacterium sp. ER1/6]OEI70165.1 restriction endonuclease [Curtobacterium sp. ER1/6]
MAREVATGLVASRIADIAPAFFADVYRVSGVRPVGVLWIAGLDLWIRPKTLLRRLCSKFGYARA